jgi:hypothetical protein
VAPKLKVAEQAAAEAILGQLPNEPSSQPQSTGAALRPHADASGKRPPQLWR